MNVNGVVSASTTYHYSDKIYVKDLQGETLYFSNAGTPYNARYVTAFDNTGSPVAASGQTTASNSYVVPAGIYYIVASTARPASSFAVEPDYISSFRQLYFDEYTLNGYPPIKQGVSIPKPLQLKADSLTQLSSLNLTTAQSESGVCYGDQSFVFFCKIPNGIDGYIMVGKDSARGYAVGVNNTSLAYFTQNALVSSEIPHNLTLRDYVCISVHITDSDHIAHIRVETNGGEYTRTNTSWVLNHGRPYCHNHGSITITDVRLTWTAGAFRKRNWVFGDSYISYSLNRWPRYIFDWGYDNILINGYPGEGARAGYNDWVNALNYGKPSVAIWTYGMNNPDTSTEVNADWLTFTRLFLEDCQRYDITPILATIPCVSSVNNTLKNAWVRNSGYRYIEMANTVNVSENSSTWYDGMLSDDNVHPTSNGAIALACSVLDAVPEIMVKL